MRLRYAVSRALEVADKYSLTHPPSVRDLIDILDDQDIIFLQFPFRGRLMERYTKTPDGISVLTVKSGLEEPDLKHMIAHGLGHHFLHGGNRAYMHGLFEDKLEAQAEDFAAILLLPPEAIRECPGDGRALAAWARVPEKVAWRRVGLWKACGA